MKARSAQTVSKIKGHHPTHTMPPMTPTATAPSHDGSRYAWHRDSCPKCVIIGIPHPVTTHSGTLVMRFRNRVPIESKNTPYPCSSHTPPCTTTWNHSICPRGAARWTVDRPGCTWRAHRNRRRRRCVMTNQTSKLGSERQIPHEQHNHVRFVREVHLPCDPAQHDKCNARRNSRVHPVFDRCRRS